MKAVYALCGDPELARRSVDALRAAGVPDSEITVISSEPLEEYEFSQRDHKTVMPWVAALGGLLGGCSGFLLASTTQKLWPLPTGNMPIVTTWTDGIITYELTMLGAIVATLFTLLLTARIPSWKSKLYDASVSEGYILVGVENPAKISLAALETRLREAGNSLTKMLSE